MDHDHHDHGDHDEGHHGHHHHHHHHAPDPEDAPRSPLGLALRYALAAVFLAAAVTAACVVMVPAGEAVVITRFGAPARVADTPGLTWKLPPPLESTVAVDLRLRTTSTGEQDVGTRDGLRILLQAYVAWRVPADPERIRVFLRAARNDPDEAAQQLRSLVGASLQVTASSFDFAELVNTDAKALRLADFEARLTAQVAKRLSDVYGIEVTEVGIERLSLPAETMTATVARMSAERQTVATERSAEGLRQAAAIRAAADRDSRVAVAQARTQAATIEAQSQAEAARIEAESFAADPELYTLLRSLDSIAAMVGTNTRLILRTDALPFSALTKLPDGAGK
jgi:membrane protease subunit HflC